MVFWTALPVFALLVTLVIAGRAGKAFCERIKAERLGWREMANLISNEFRLSGDMIPKILAVMFAALFLRLGVWSLATGYRPALEWPLVGRTWLGLFFGWVLYPVGEEVLYRGVVFRFLRKRLRLPAVLVVSSVLFAVYHPVLGGYSVCPWLYLFSMFMSGLAMGVLYVWTGGSLAAVILAHAATNVCTYCLK